LRLFLHRYILILIPQVQGVRKCRFSFPLSCSSSPKSPPPLLFLSPKNATPFLQEWRRKAFFFSSGRTATRFLLLPPNQSTVSSQRVYFLPPPLRTTVIPSSLLCQCKGEVEASSFFISLKRRWYFPLPLPHGDAPPDSRVAVSLVSFLFL